MVFFKYIEKSEGYKPSQEEIDNAESIMAWWQARDPAFREGTYGQLSEEQRASYREMQIKGEIYREAMKKSGFLDRSLDEMMGDIRAGKMQKSKDGKTVAEVLGEARAEFEKRFSNESL